MSVRLLLPARPSRCCFLCTPDGSAHDLCGRHRFLLALRWISFFLRHPAALDLVRRRRQGRRPCYVCCPELDALDVAGTTLCLRHQVSSRFLFYPLWRRRYGRWAAIRKMSCSFWRIAVHHRRYR